MNPTIAVSTIAFRDEKWLKVQAPYLASQNLLQLVAHAKKSWNGDEIDPNPDVGAGSIWPTETAQRNESLAMLGKMGHQWAIILDTDEYLTPEGLRLLVAFLGQTKASVVLAGKMVTLFKSVDWAISPPETHKPVIAIRLDQRFTDNRCHDPRATAEVWDGGTLFHASYARTDEEMLRKLKTFAHAKEIRPQWYETVWLGWTPLMKNLHPIHPADYAGVTPSNLPDEVRDHFERVTNVPR